MPIQQGSGDYRLTLPADLWIDVERERAQRPKIGRTAMTLDAYVSQTIESFLAVRRIPHGGQSPRESRLIRIRLPVDFWPVVLSEAMEVSLRMLRLRARRRGAPIPVGMSEDTLLEAEARAEMVES